jgi:hypothetical protein
MRGRKRAIALLTALGACVSILTGCSGETVEEPIRTSTIVLAADGSFTQCRVEDFDRDDYQLSELDGMIRREVQDYVGEAAGDGQTVTVEQVSSLEENDAQAMVALHFADSEVYKDYRAQVDNQSCELFYGTVQEALEAGYDLAGVLQDAKKGTDLTSEQLAKIGGNRVLIFEENLQIRCPSKVLYISSNVQITDAGYVDGTEGEGLKYVVIK